MARANYAILNQKTARPQVASGLHAEWYTVPAELQDKRIGRVSGRSKPAREGRMKTSHFEGSIVLCAAMVAPGRDEPTQRELATFDINFGGQWLVPPADCARTGYQPGDGGQISAAGPVKTGHSDLWLWTSGRSKTSQSDPWLGVLNGSLRAWIYKRWWPN